MEHHGFPVGSDIRLGTLNKNRLTTFWLLIECQEDQKLKILITRVSTYMVVGHRMILGENSSFTCLGDHFNWICCICGNSPPFDPAFHGSSIIDPATAFQPFTRGHVLRQLE